MDRDGRSFFIFHDFHREYLKEIDIPHIESYVSQKSLKIVI